jgi:hypothetical protein
VVESASKRCPPILNRHTPLAFVGILAALVIVIVATTSAQKAAPQPDLKTQSWGEAVNGLQMSISRDEDATGPNRAMHLKVEFRNVSNELMTILLGTRCGPVGGDTSEITLNLLDSEGIRHRLPFLGDGPPYPAGCLGEMTFLIVPLPRGASLSLPLDLGKYLDLSDPKNYVGTRFHAGTYSLQAQLTEGPPSGPPSPRWSWSGTVTSNRLQVTFDAEFVAPLDVCGSQIGYAPSGCR